MIRVYKRVAPDGALNRSPRSAAFQQSYSYLYPPHRNLPVAGTATVTQGRRALIALRSMFHWHLARHAQADAAPSNQRKGRAISARWQAAYPTLHPFAQSGLQFQNFSPEKSDIHLST